MIRQIRKKVASSLSEIELPDSSSWQKWLRPAIPVKREVEPFYYKLEKVAHLNKWISPVLNSAYTSPVAVPELVDVKINYTFAKVRTNAVFFGIGNPGQQKVELNNKFPRVTSSSEKFFLSETGISTELPLIKRPKQLRIIYQFKEPNVHDKFASIKPKIINIDLLNIQNSAEWTEQIKQINFQNIHTLPRLFKVRIQSLSNLVVPPIFNLKTGSITALGIQKVNIPSVNIPVLSEAYFRISATKIKQLPLNELKAGKIKTEDYKSLLPLLQPSRKIGAKEEREILSRLYPHQVEAVKLLAANNYVFITDDPALDVYIQIVSALKILFRQNDVKNTLIITSQNRINQPIVKESGYLNRCWEPYINELLPRHSFAVVTGDAEKRKSLWNKPVHIAVASYTDLFKDIANDLLDKRTLAKFNCVVLDEPSQLKNYNKSDSEFLLKSLNPEFLYIAGTNNDLQILNKLSEKADVNFEEFKAISRSREDISHEIFPQQNILYWSVMEDEQQQEYELALKKGQENIYFLLDEGNPVRLQGNIFTLVHQLTQITNFSGKKSSGIKADLMLNLLNGVIAAKQKCLILSQYDKGGTKKIEKFLELKGVNFISYQAGMSTQELSQLIERFNKSKDASVFVAGTKSARFKWELKDLSHLIHFDRWWNPVSVWSAEEAVGNNNATISSILTKNSIEEKIYQTLADKGMLNRNVFETLSADYVNSFFNLNDWLRIFNLSDLIKEKDKPGMSESLFNRMNKLGDDVRLQAIKNFFMRLGYTRLIEEEDRLMKNRLIIHGMNYKNGREIRTLAAIFSGQNISIDMIRDFILERMSSEYEKLFILLPDIFTLEEQIAVPANTSVIDGKQLVNYLNLFGVIKTSQTSNRA